ncbi:MAG TPA: efflux transporter outer membrane subunit [Gemmataceae bacterium]|nr:efflux transporter outer membrane subunit [Gemmataceae bacterium]
MERRASSPSKYGLGGARPLRRWLGRAGLAGAILVNGGCVATGPVEWIRNGFKVGPNYDQPQGPVAPEWIEARDPRVQDRHLQDWWTVFQDGRLSSLIDTAYQQNLTLRSAGARVLEARAQQAIAAGSFFPQTQQATGEISRVGLSRNAANNPASLLPVLAGLPGSNLIPGREVPTNWFTDMSGGFNLSWELDFWGRFRRAIESANANLDASLDSYDDALVTLLADVATNYVQFRISQQRIQIAQENVGIQERILALAEERFRVGVKATRLDVEQARTVLEQTRSSIPAQQITLGQANDTLCILLGIPVRDLEPELGAAPGASADPVPSTPKWVATGIPADLLRRRPDVRQAERRVAAESAEIGVAEADLYPSIFINGTLGWEAQDLSQLFESRSFMGSITPNFRWNILNYGRISNNVRLQQMRTQELIATYQNKVLTAGREVQTSLRGFLRSQEQAEALARSVEAATAATELGETQYRTGVIDFNTVFNLAVTRVQQQDQLAIARGNVALNLINVYRALGGGWELRCERENGRVLVPGPGVVDGMAQVATPQETLPPKPNTPGQGQ